MRREGLKPGRSRSSRSRTSRGKSHLLPQLVFLSNRTHLLKREIRFPKGLWAWQSRCGSSEGRQSVPVDIKHRIGPGVPLLHRTCACLEQLAPEKSEKQKCYKSLLKISGSCSSRVAAGSKSGMPQRAPKPAPLPRVPGEPRVPAAGPIPLGALHPAKGQEGRRGRACEVQWAISEFFRNLLPRQSPHRSQGEF